MDAAPEGPSAPGHRCTDLALSPQQSSRLLGFPADARLLIISCDDLGMHPGVNKAVLEAVQSGVASSCSLMVPCPAAAQAMRLLKRAPDVPFGIHLTLTRDGPTHRWAPVCPPHEVPSPVDEDGLLFTSANKALLLAQARVADVERELTAQIDVVAAHDLTPTHLDWHVPADGGRPDLMALTMRLARRHGLAARVWLAPAQRAARQLRLPVVDHAFLDSFAIDLDSKAEHYVQLLRRLPIGLSEWAVHPAVGQETARVADLGWRVRRSDHAFLMSALARRALQEAAITVIDYSRLQHAWWQAASDPHQL